MPRKKVANLARHSIQVNESTYTTALSNQATKNVLYDENLINKKVSVNISKGINKGKTLIGTVTRSLLPDRKKIPYLIKFNDTDNQTDEKVSEIPNTGISLYKEPVSTTQANKGKRKEKANAKGKGNKKGNKKKNTPPAVTTSKKKTPPTTTPPTPANVRRSNRNK